MIYVYITMLLMLNVCWLVSVLLTVPGNWLMVLTTFAFAWWKSDAHLFGVPVLVLIAVLAAAITPTVDPVNMALLMGPLFILYLLSVLVAYLASEKKSNGKDKKER